MRLITKHNAMSNAFTLAEVLITLAIIGVVAAMTMPTLISNTNGAQFKTAYKKALSVLSQAVVMNIALDEYDLAGTVAYDASDTDKYTLTKIFEDRTNGTLYTGTLADDAESEESSEGKLKYSITLTTDDFDSDAATKLTSSIDLSNYHIFTFMDNTMFAFDPSQNSCTEAAPCFGFIDANGIKGPNKNVTCTTGSGSSEETGDDTTVTVKECTSKVTINDIFPVKFYDQTVAPASASARAVLYGSENMEETNETQQNDGGA